MRLAYFKEPARANFGDDLNRWMWNALLPNHLGDDEDVFLSGIGTILNAALMPPGRKRIVLGSGAGYGNPPADFGGPNWHVLAVRGPLSATVLHLSADRAVTDAAILLREIEAMQPLPESERSGIVFMPHYQSIPAGRWQQACALAGVEYLDPLGDSRQLVERIRRAKLVLADAMHAAIVADTLRVPWIPVVTSTAISTFKWLDWTQSLRIEYRPVYLHPSSRVQQLRNATNRIYGEEHSLRLATTASALAYFARDQKLQSTWWWKTWVRSSRGITYTVPTKLLRAVSSALSKHREMTRAVEQAANSLRCAAALSPMLSDDRIFDQRRNQMREALAQVPLSLQRLRAAS